MEAHAGVFMCARARAFSLLSFSYAVLVRYVSIITGRNFSELNLKAVTLIMRVRVTLQSSLQLIYTELCILCFHRTVARVLTTGKMDRCALLSAACYPAILACSAGRNSCVTALMTFVVVFIYLRYFGTYTPARLSCPCAMASR